MEIWQKSVGDINGDGLPDLIAGGRSGGGLVWYQNPSWTKHTIASGGEHSTDGEVVDMDGDGDNDYVSLTTSELRWYENPSWTIHTIDNRTLHDVEVADFDRDGDIDIVARNQAEFGNQGNILHFYRQNTPTSWTHRALTCPDGEGLHVEDLDGDNFKDVIINSSWFQNPGDIINGAWSKHIYSTSWSHPNTYVDTADVNNDSRLDIILSPSELAGQTYHISWFEAPSDPTAGSWTEHIVEKNVEAVHHFVGAADFDNDGDIDIASAEMEQGADPDEIKIILNNGAGLSWTKTVLANSGSHSMRILDVDSDGDMDLFGANWQGSIVELWKNQSDPKLSLDKWQRNVLDQAKPWKSVFIAAGDLNADSQPDVITGGWWYQNPGTAGGLWPRHTIGSPLNNMAAVYDFDQDGALDILGTEGQGSNANDSFVWAHNDGSGNFTVYNNIPNGDGDFLQGTEVDRFHNDGNLDVALSWHLPSMGTQTLTIPVDPLNTTWGWSKISPASQDEDLSSGDIDSDGDFDLLLGTKWLRNENGSWSTFTLNPTADNPDRNQLADINQDGKLDAIVGFEAISIQGKLTWYQQPSTPTATWTEHVIANLVGPMSMDVADMDQDGDWDVIVGEHNLADPNSAKLFIFENVDGHGGSWESHLVYTGDEHHDGAQVVDIDNDGDLDIISIGWGHNKVLLYENLAIESIP